MGQCMCKQEWRARRRRRRRREHSAGQDDDREVTAFPPLYHTQRLYTLGLDVKDLVIETLSVIRTLVNNEQEPPQSILKLNLIADREQGWLLIVQTMIDIVPADNPLGPAVITLFLDESPLPTKETVAKLLFLLNLSGDLVRSSAHPPSWHKNLCIVLGCLSEKLAGPNSVATFHPSTLDYLIENLNPSRMPYVILHALITLEKYAQTSENKITISERLLSLNPNPVVVLEKWIDSEDYVEKQVGFCAQWLLDNVFINPGRKYSYETVLTDGINVMLNNNDVSEYLKISPDGLEARCDVSSFESVRCTFPVNNGVWYYEALIVTPGVMQIGWATKNSKFLNHEGYGIGDDEYSVAYDGCRQLLWHNASSQSTNHPMWNSGDILGSLINLNKKEIMFYLNGEPLLRPHKDVFRCSQTGFFVAASFMSFQQCQFNFGYMPFRYPPNIDFQCFNDHASLSKEQRVILPRHKKIEMLHQQSIPEGACTLCVDKPGSCVLKPCDHGGLCSECALVLEQCPFCRKPIELRLNCPVTSS